MDDKMLVPDKIKVGYQKRNGTYTGKLAYVIYYDTKGKLRKEKSWESWRDSKIKPNDFDNVPTSGFVLNRGVGGARESWSSWNTRNEYIRVWDPRDFEFEISVKNLLFILQETSAIKGKGLEGEFVYAWSGTELVLLPVDSQEYIDCVAHTNRQKIKFKKEDLKEGFSYLMKNGEEVMYLGRFPYNNYSPYSYNGGPFNPVGNKHIFVKISAIGKSSKEEPHPYLPQSGFTKIAETTSPKALESFPDERDKFLKSKWYGEVADVKVARTKYDYNKYSRYYAKTLLIKEGDKYYPCRVQSVSGWEDVPGSHRKKELPTRYLIRKSSKEFKPELVSGKPIIPPPPNEDTHRHHYGYGYNTHPEYQFALTEGQLHKQPFYALKAITPTGGFIQI